MSLNWNATQVELWEEFSDEQKNKCAHFAFELMGIGIGEVRQDNLATIMSRLAFWTSLFGDEQKYSLDEVRSYIGFTVNVSTETDHAWVTRVSKNRLNELSKFYESRTLTPA
jgi:hypothetical protein